MDPDLEEGLHRPRRHQAHVGGRRPGPTQPVGTGKPNKSADYQTRCRRGGGWAGGLPVHRDAEDLLHGAEDLADHFLAPVGSVLRDDDGLPDFCSESTQEIIITPHQV